MKQRSRITALVAFLAGTALTAGQTPQSAPPQAPTFKVQVDYVDVDVLATDQLGRFVRDLTRDDFQVFEDGKPQTIASFSVVDIPIERADRPLYSPEPFEPDVVSNEKPFEGRIYVMILDDLHTNVLRSSKVKTAARQFIQRNLGANDVMAIVHTGGRTDAAQEFTNSKRLLLASVDRFMGRKLDSATLARNEAFQRSQGSRLDDPDDAERGFNARSTLTILKDVAEWFGGVRGRRKTILFVSEGLDYDITNVFNNRSTLSVFDDTREAIASATRYNVSIYCVDPRGLTQLADETIAVSGFADQLDPATGVGSASLRNELRVSQDSLRVLADETGGFAAVNSNQFTTAFDRIVTDNSSYYLLAYYPLTDKRDGKFHRIEVRVKRPGVTVRARRGYVGAKPKSAPKTTGEPRMSLELLEALNSPLKVSGLTMRVFVAPFKGAAPNASVLVGVELLGRDLTLGPNSKIEISYMAVDAKGKRYGAKTDVLTMNLRPEARARVEQTGVRILNRMELPPGRYQLRVASHDVAGPVGSVLHDIEIPEYSKLPFSMSGLLLTSLSGASVVLVQADEETKTVLPAPPIAQRTFSQNDEVALFAEIYDDGNAPPHKVDITTTIRSDEGRVFFKNEEERASSELEGKRGGYGYTGRIPLTGLAPGPYVLTVEARSRLGQQTAASRQVRITVVPPVEAAGPPTR